jgi:probable rRNA maturation factor
VSTKFSLSVQYASDAQNLPTRGQLRRWFEIALQRDASITLRIVDEIEGRELNKNFRGKDYATNVLTFVYDEIHPDLPLSAEGSLRSGGVHTGVLLAGAGKGTMLSGDIVFCAPVVASEAIAQHKDLLAHYAHLTLHAALHLQGYEHENDSDAAGMEALETALMLKLHYPDPYQAS